MPRKRPLVSPPPPPPAGDLQAQDVPKVVAPPPPRPRRTRLTNPAEKIAALAQRAAKTGALPCKLVIFLTVDDYAAIIDLAEEYGEDLGVVTRTVLRRGLRASQFTPGPQAGQQPFYEGLPRRQQVPLGTEFPPIPPQGVFAQPQQQPVYPAWRPPPSRVIVTEDTEAVFAGAQVNPAMLPQGFTTPVQRPAPPPPPETTPEMPPEPRLFVDD